MSSAVVTHFKRQKLCQRSFCSQVHVKLLIILFPFCHGRGNYNSKLTAVMHFLTPSILQNTDPSFQPSIVQTQAGVGTVKFSYLSDDQISVSNVSLKAFFTEKIVRDVLVLSALNSLSLFSFPPSLPPFLSLSLPPSLYSSPFFLSSSLRHSLTQSYFPVFLYVQVTPKSFLLNHTECLPGYQYDSISSTCVCVETDEVALCIEDRKSILLVVNQPCR